MVLKGAAKMNIGFYVKSCNADGVNAKIFTCLNDAIKDRSVSDASLFFDNIDYNPVETNFGMFNSTSMWHFTGNLVTTSMETTRSALKATNKYELCYLYNRDDIDVLQLIDTSKQVDIITQDQREHDYIYRVTGIKPKLLKDFTVASFAEVF